MKKVFTSLIVMLIWAGNSWADTNIFTENFDGSWTVPSTLSPAWSGTTTAYLEWHRNDYCTGWSYGCDGGYSPSGALATANSARFNTYGIYYGGSSDFITPVIDLSAYTTGINCLEFYHINPSGTDELSVYLSIDGGSTWGSALVTCGATSTWQLHTAIALGTTSATVKIKFTGISDYMNDDIGLDQVRVYNFTPTVPTLAVFPSAINLGYSPVGVPSVPQTYTLSGSGLADGPVVITAPGGFEVSPDGATWFDSYSLSYTPPDLPGTTVYARFLPPLANSNFAGDITNVGGGTSINVSLSGTSWEYLKWCNTSWASTTADEDIFNVTVGTLNNSSDCSTLAPGYGSLQNSYSNYFYDVSPPELLRGSVYDLSVQVSTCGGNYTNVMKVYIDYNSDGDFTDSEEEVFVSASFSTPSTQTGTFTVPSSATPGYTMMRVVDRETSYPEDVSSCGSYSYGETEDYKVNIVTPSTPFMFSVPSSLNFGIISSGSTSDEMTYSLEGENLSPADGEITITPPSNFEISLTTGTGFSASPITLAYTGGTIAAATVYAVFKPTSSNTDYSGNITNTGGSAPTVNVAVTGSSLCDVITTFPFTEGFENGGALPDCWFQEYVLGTRDWAAEISGVDGFPPAAHSGTYLARFNLSYYFHFQTKLITPPLDLSGVTNPVLSFWHTQANWGGDQDELRVYYKTSEEGAWTLIPGQEYTTDIPVWTEESGILLPNPSDYYFIAFEGYESYGYGVCLDDVTVQAGGGCLPPQALVASNITATSADLDWEAPPIEPESFFDVSYGIQGYDPETQGTIISGIAAPPYTLAPPLDPLTNYDCYVRTVCSSFELPKQESFWVAFNEYAELVTTINPATGHPYSGGAPVDDQGEDGIYYFYQTPQIPWYNVWFYNGPLDKTRMKIIRMGFWAQTLAGGTGTINYVVNWSDSNWVDPDPANPSFPTPDPADTAFIERSPINGPIQVGAGPQWFEVYYIIPDYNPEWVSVDLFGQNVQILYELQAPPETSPIYDWWVANPQVGGILLHECLPKPVGNVSSWSGPSQFTTTCPIYDVPFGESFFDDWPGCWTEQLTGLITVNHWSVVNSNYAGGTAKEAMANYNPPQGASDVDNDRLVSPAINTSAYSSIHLSFRHMLNDFTGGNVWIKVQSSADGTTWMDEWVQAGGCSCTIPAEMKELDITNNLGGTTWLAWTLSGNTYNINYWYVDEVRITFRCIWTGMSNSLWNDAANWSCGQVPYTDMDIIIPSAPPGGIFPIVPAGYFAECNALTVEPGAIVTVEDGATLNVLNPTP